MFCQTNAEKANADLGTYQPSKKEALPGHLWDFDEENICCCDETRLVWSALENRMQAVPVPVWGTKE